MSRPAEPDTVHSSGDPVCSCARVRRAARRLTQAYDRALAPAGLKLTQYSLLVNALKGNDSITGLARAVAVERTTLTRNLRPLERDGLVRVVAGEDARRRRVQVTAAGRRVLARARDLWREAERDFVHCLGERDASRLHSLLERAERWQPR